MSALRPLPPRPSLEFEHKEAKALLRRLRAGDPEALARARARHPAMDASAPERIRLADAQLVIAREYGFTSWPRLVQYFGDVARQRYYYHEIHGDATRTTAASVDCSLNTPNGVCGPGVRSPLTCRDSTACARTTSSRRRSRKTTRASPWRDATGSRAGRCCWNARPLKARNGSTSGRWTR